MWATGPAGSFVCVRAGVAQADEVRRVVPVFALATAVVAAVTDATEVPSELILAAVPVAAFLWWALSPRAPLALVTALVLVPTVLALRTDQLEPLLLEASLLGFVVGRWVGPLALSAAYGLLAVATPVVSSLVQDPSGIEVGVWMLGIAFPWLVGRAVATEQHLAAELQATREQLAERALLDQRRRIARDVHDLVGHGLAAMLLQVTSARHVLRRDPDAAEAGLRDAEEIGRRAMQDLRGTVGLLRGDDEEIAPALPSLREVPRLVDHARGGGLAVELRVSGDLSRVGPSVDAALYRIAQETLANAVRHAPAARTRLAVEVENDAVRLHAQTSGPIARASEPERPRYGLVGMRERAVTLGGELRAGPTPDGWRVDCRLPLEAA